MDDTSMTESFLEKVRNGIAVDKSQIVGYDDEEITRIERVCFWERGMKSLKEVPNP